MVTAAFVAGCQRAVKPVPRTLRGGGNVRGDDGKRQLAGGMGLRFANGVLGRLRVAKVAGRLRGDACNLCQGEKE